MQTSFAHYERIRIFRKARRALPQAGAVSAPLPPLPARLPLPFSERRPRQKIV